ncbi:MAG: 3-isopropylmalate dehydratase small subunit [Burkholderiales bacterium]|nr:3-isopropylmalate dehydratase small subunit [Burkholderiales bacterium]
MRALERVTSVVVPMPETNVNTDQIAPARFLHKERVDYGRYCFHDLRFDAQGRALPGCVLNEPRYAGAQILLAGLNFGCGSSREQAVFMLADFGFRVILAPSFGDIFYGNCFNNGILPVVLSPSFAARLFDALAASPQAAVTVDLVLQHVVAPDGERFHFDVDPFRRNCLLQGLDEIDITLTLRDAIDRFEASRNLATKELTHP